MEILAIVLGVIMVLCGVSCTFTPLATFLEAGYFVAVLMFVYGIAGIVKSISVKDYGLYFLFSILSFIGGIIVLSIPSLRLMLDGMLVYMVAGWFIIQGLVSIYLSVRFRKINGTNKWILTLVFGAFGVILGFISFVRPGMLAAAIGVMIGVYFMVAGFNMISLAISRIK